MPATYSKNRDPNKQTPKHTGGPLQRTGSQSVLWDKALGPSLESLPSSQLPLVRSVLQRYRAIRIMDPNKSLAKIAVTLAHEVKNLWDKAHTPTASDRVCAKRVEDAINLWNKTHRAETKLSADFQAKLDVLLDLKPKTAGRKGPDTKKKELNKYKSHMKKVGIKKWKAGHESDSDMSDWEQDYNFYIDQSEGNRQQHMAGIDGKLRLRKKKQRARNDTPRDPTPSTSSGITTRFV